MTNYLSHSIVELHDMLVAKKIKPIDLVEEAIQKIETSDLNAFVTICKEEARKEAKRLENMEVDHLFFGIPVAIKDNILTKNVRTTCSSKMLEQFDPIYDATVIEKIKQAHMIVIGKTNMDEFAMGSTTETSYFGITHNPWNYKKVPGGSSGGSAAAVASLIVPVALGSDTGGSIRQPSSFCGIVGMKPTYGRVSRYGLVAFASSLDQIGPMTRTVHENAAFLEILAGEDHRDLTSSKKEVECYSSYCGKEIQNLRIAVPTYYMSDVIDVEVKQSVEEVLERLKQAGCQIDMVEIPYLEYAIPLYQIIALGEASSNLARFDGIKYGYHTTSYQSLDEFYKKTRGEGFGREVKRRIMIGSYVLSGKNAQTYYHKALVLRKELTKGFEHVFENYDLILGPTNTGVAYDLGTKSDDALKSFYDDLLTIPVNMAGLPALSMPISKNQEGLPIGLQIIGNYFQEGSIYQLASWIEKKVNFEGLGVKE